MNYYYILKSSMSHKARTTGVNARGMTPLEILYTKVMTCEISFTLETITRYS